MKTRSFIKNLSLLTHPQPFILPTSLLLPSLTLLLLPPILLLPLPILLLLLPHPILLLNPPIPLLPPPTLLHPPFFLLLRPPSLPPFLLLLRPPHPTLGDSFFHIAPAFCYLILTPLFSSQLILKKTY